MIEYLLDGHFETVKNANSAKIILPFRFPGGGRLELLATEKYGSVIFSDCGAAYRELSAKTDDPYILGDVFDHIASVYMNVKPPKDRELIRPISASDMRRYFGFLQCVSICANADLYPFVNDEMQKEYDRYSELWVFPEDGKYPEGFIEDMKRSLTFEDGIIRSGFAFKDETDPMSIQVVRGSGVFTLTDRGGFDGGDIIERIKWNNKDGIGRFAALVKNICTRFGAEYDGGEFSIAFKDGDPLTEAVFTFMQFASILGELGSAVTVG